MDLSVLGILGNVIHTIQKITTFDEKFLGFSEILEEVQYKLEDVTTNIRNYRDQIDFEPKTLENIEMRLNLINMLKRKYGESIHKILKYKQELEAEIQEFKNNEEKVEKIKKEIDFKYNELKKSSIKLSKLRRNVAINFEKKLTEILLTLNMDKVKFKVSFNNEINNLINTKFSTKGIDKIEFIISTNLGEPLKPLSKIASGVKCPE